VSGDQAPARLRVAIVGAGLIGTKRAGVLGQDELVGVYDVDDAAARRLAQSFETAAAGSLDELWALTPDVVIVAVPHHLLAENAIAALGAGAHVLVEKPAGIGVRQIDAIAEAAASAGRLVKVGFNHRFHPAIARAVTEARSGRFGEVMFARARYGHGGRLGYEKEWRMRPELSGGGELIDQGMHLLDIFYWVLGPLPLHSALLRTQYWTPAVEDNAVVVLGEQGYGDRPWGMFHVTWTEWKNMFSLEIYCRTGKLQVEGLQGSYGSPRLHIYAMRPELGPPDAETIEFGAEDRSWELEWQHLRDAVVAGDFTAAELLGDLASARYAWECVERAQELGGYRSAGDRAAAARP
jgi:predicted dehydrogenase